MSLRTLAIFCFIFTAGFPCSQCLLSSQTTEGAWVIDSQSAWEASTNTKSNLEFKTGMALPTEKNATFQSTMKTFDKKRSASSIVFEQSAIWQNWEPVENIGPANLKDAPVALSLGPNNYWLFGRYGKPNKKELKNLSKFKSESATLEGFDIPLKTTRHANQFDAAGGLKPGKGGYHAWQSRDMVNWVHHGSVTERFSCWVTTAEFVDGKLYIYYDYPNDQDPHLYIDDNLMDGVPGKNMGIAFKDPSDGSDSGLIRDLEGKFHVIYEDWSPINAGKRSWDSPLAGHAVSEDGIKDFKIMNPVIDNRTKPTGEKKTYKHPHWKSHPEWDTNIAEYEVHQPEQEAYGDWASICIAGQYYLFGDFDPVGGHKMSVGWFTSPSLDQEFTWCDSIGQGHPDPDICFAEGRFYLVTQQKQDFASPGPWVETVESRVGVDTNNDGKIDEWTEWQAAKETYDYTKGFAKQIKKTPASIDLSKLPAGFGFQIEVKITDTTENKSKPILDSVTVNFGE
ncbi:MAG: hypothetical protein ACI87E_002820 [Mariniblastus sp.]|jgi:hypothetical protein